MDSTGRPFYDLSHPIIIIILSAVMHRRPPLAVLRVLWHVPWEGFLFNYFLPR